MKYSKSSPPHSRLSPSSADRWTACPGSLALCDLVPDNPSEYADDGSLAHEIAAAWLTEGEPDSITDEMRDAIRTYVDYVSMIFVTHDVAKIMVEERIESSIIPDFGGTPDCVIFYNDGVDDIIEVVDFKYGAGVLVDARSKQMQCYLHLAGNFWIESGYKFKHGKRLGYPVYRATVVQPRREHVQSVDYARHELDWIDKFVETKDLHPGKHCQFCPAAHACPEILEKVIEHVDTPPNKLMTVTELKSLLDCETGIKAALKQARQQCQDHIQEGGQVPGYKLVTSLGNRTWVNSDEETLAILRRAKLGKKKATATKLLSPTQMLKIKDLTPKQIGLINHLVFRPTRGLKLVPESAAGEPVEFPSVADQFEEIVENE